MNDTSEERVACDEMVRFRIDRAMSACFKMASELMFMKTITSQTAVGRDRLMNGLNEIVDMNKSMIDELRKLNGLIWFGDENDV